MINKFNILESIRKRDIFLQKNFTDQMPSWEKINNLYDKSINSENVIFSSFGTMVVNKSDQYIDFYNNFINFFKNLTDWNFSQALTIIHFINKNNNIINDDYAKKISEKFYKDNPKKKPNEVILSDYSAEPLKYFEPEIHSDKSHNFFIQGQGKTLWKIYHDEKLFKEYIIEEGDLVYIPENLMHSVESLCPRFAVSLIFNNI
jgi:cupin superfamily acireductone dioxygenase involved in methionine salvage